LYRRIQLKGHNCGTPHPGITKMIQCTSTFVGMIYDKFHLDHLNPVGKIWDTTFHQQTSHQ